MFAAGRVNKLRKKPGAGRLDEALRWKRNRRRLLDCLTSVWLFALQSAGQTADNSQNMVSESVLIRK